MNINLDFTEIGKRIQNRRTEIKMTQDQLAELVGTTQKHISQIEMGNHDTKLTTIAAIAKYLQVSVDYLIADYEDSTNESTLKVIMDEIRGMSAKQLEILRDNIKTIKKYER